MKLIKLKLALLLLLILPASAHAELRNGMDADVVIGQPDFTTTSSGVSQTKLTNPQGVCSDGKRLIVSEYSNQRVLIWNSIPKSNGVPADIVLGQPDFTSNGGGTSATKFTNPRGVFTDGKRLFLAEQGNNRVLIWNQMPTASNTPADVVVGQASFTTNGNVATRSGLFNPDSVFSDGKRLIVADLSNARVLIWNSIPTVNGVPADIVLGQPDFTTNSTGISASKMAAPEHVFFDGTRLFVTEREPNHRVLIYNKLPSANSTPADVVLGQSDFISNTTGAGPNKFNRPFSTFSDGNQLFISDFLDHRVLIWRSIPTENGASADIVLGQDNFFSVTPGTGRNKFNLPLAVFLGGKRFFVTDALNNRVLIFNIGGGSGIDLGPQFEQGKSVVGKVFWDLNGNGKQDAPSVISNEVRDPETSHPSGRRSDALQETGIEGVKVVSDTGIYAITDEDGKYHFPFIETGQRILKIDESTLPEDSVVTTESPRKIVVTKGILVKVSFGVKLPNDVISSEARNLETSHPSGLRNDKDLPLLKVAISQDASALKPRLSVSAEQLRDPKDGKDKVIFTIDCNYFLFVKRSELKLYDENQKLIKALELPNPLPLYYELPLSDLPPGLQTLYYQLSVFDAKNHEDRTGIGFLTLGEPKD